MIIWYKGSLSKTLRRSSAGVGKGERCREESLCPRGGQAGGREGGRDGGGRERERERETDRERVRETKSKAVDFWRKVLPRLGGVAPVAPSERGARPLGL
jgi:hypothetical protein